jgi:hypothetical protein
VVPNSRPWWQELAGLSWLAVFLLVFFRQPLPNNQVARTDVAAAWWSSGVIARQPLPFELLDALDPPQEPGRPRSGLGYFPQRVPLWSTAALIVVGAWGLGCLLLHRLPLPPLDAWECLTVRALVGLSALSLATLGLGYLGLLSQPVFVGGLLLASIAGGWVAWRERPCIVVKVDRAARWWGLAALPFLTALLLGAVTPPTDFDVKAYHLTGPKEWFQQGRIVFLEHNVYTSFPFLSEMLLLAGMCAWGDWYWGGVAGQVVQMLFAPLTALGLANLGRRWGAPTAGHCAAVLYLSTPWIYRTGIIPYAEGGWTAYGFAAFAAAGWFSEALTADRRVRCGTALLVGVLAGSAMACKYPGLLTAVIPLGLWLVVFTGMRCRTAGATGTALAAYLVGVALAVGPWLLKNFVETGNPVYPLAYTLFGGRDLDAAWAAQWQRAHPSEGLASLSGRDLLRQAFDIAAVNDWQSPLLFALAPLAFGVGGTVRRRLAAAGSLLGWIFVMWWLLMHHIDRFWVPLLPFAALLAGFGQSMFESRWGRGVVRAVLVGGGLYSLAFCMTGLGGYNAGLTDLQDARRIAASTNPAVAWLNAARHSGELPPQLNVLCVGEAQVFDAEFSCVYNTVFDRSRLELWCAPRAGEPSTNELRPPAEIRETFRQHGITHVLANWGEILRYRQTYGYTDYVHPRRFAALQAAGILGSPWPVPAELAERPLERLSPAEVQHLESWAPELIHACGDSRCLVVWQLYPVLK